MDFFLLENLPLELQSLTLSKCSYLSLYQLSRTSKHFKEKVEKDELLWRYKTMRDFRSVTEINYRGEWGWWKTYRYHRDELGKQLLDSVRQFNSQSALKILRIDDYANLPVESKKSSLRPASANGLTTVIAALHRCGIDLDAVLERDYTALILASRWARLPTVKFLLENGANVNAQNCFGYTALMWASEIGNKNIVETLLDFGAKVDLADNFMRTPLLRASRSGLFSIVQILLDANANPNHQNERGATVLMEASIEGRSRIVKLLCERNADPNIKDKTGYTALGVAFTSEIRDILRGE